MQPTTDPDCGTRRLLQRLVAERRPRFALPDVPDPGMDWVEWRAGLRDALWRALGVSPDDRPPKATVVERVACEGYTREKLYVDGALGSAVPCYLLIPEDARSSGERAPGLVCLHGHGGLAGNRHLVRLPTGPRMAQIDAELNYDYAVRFALRGYVTIAPDAHSFGERAHWSEDGIPGRGEWDGREHATLGLVAAYLGLTLPGMRLVDDMRVCAYLASRPEVDGARVGCAGLSEGGKRAMFLAALDERIAAAVVSGYFTSLRVEVTDSEWEHLHGWDVCNWIPGLLRVADFPEVLALVAPRPLLVQHGRDDALYSRRGVEEGFERLATAYAALEAADQVALDLFDGGHAFAPASAEAWLARWLPVTRPDGARGAARPQEMGN
jgi:dienelactone hydrolase